MHNHIKRSYNNKIGDTVMAEINDNMIAGSLNDTKWRNRHMGKRT